MSFDSTPSPLPDTNVAGDSSALSEGPVQTTGMSFSPPRLPLPEEMSEPSVQVAPTVDESGNVTYTITTYSRSRRQHPYVITMSLTAAIPKDHLFKRVSIVPYCTYKGVRNYFLCIDAKHGEITDPGGTPYPGEDFMTTGTRELWEETMQLFDFRSPEQMEFVRNNSIAMCNKSCIVMFLPVDVPSPAALCQDFRQRYWKAQKEKAPYHLVENSHMIWIVEDNLHKVVAQGRSSGGVKMPAELAVSLRPVALTPTTIKPAPDCYPTVFSKLRTILLVAYSACDTLF